MAGLIKGLGTTVLGWFIAVTHLFSFWLWPLLLIFVIDALTHTKDEGSLATKAIAPAVTIFGILLAQHGLVLLLHLSGYLPMIVFSLFIAYLYVLHPLLLPKLGKMFKPLGKLLGIVKKEDPNLFPLASGSFFQKV